MEIVRIRIFLDEQNEDFPPALCWKEKHIVMSCEVREFFSINVPTSVFLNLSFNNIYINE